MRLWGLYGLYLFVNDWRGLAGRGLIIIDLNSIPMMASFISLLHINIRVYIS